MSVRGKPFEKGRSGNPAGRRPGTRRATTAALESILEGDASDILRKATELAKAGDPVALRLCLDRILPVRRDRPVNFALPAVETTADLPKASNALLQAVCNSEITPSEASDIGKALDAHIQALQAADINERLARLEEARR